MNFNESQIVEDLKKSNLTLSKSELFSFGHNWLYVRNSEPASGKLTENTTISVENKEINYLSKITVAIINENVPVFQHRSQQRVYEEYVYKEYFEPYYLSGVKRYVERGC